MKKEKNPQLKDKVSEINIARHSMVCRMRVCEYLKVYFIFILLLLFVLLSVIQGERLQFRQIKNSQVIECSMCLFKFLLFKTLI